MTSAPAPRVSIALATFNGARFLPQQLESLARQSLPPLELVVGDDGSTDETLSLLAAFAQQAPFPVRVEQNPVPLGYGANFVAIAGRCQGELIAFCDQDDVWEPRKLEVMTAWFDKPEVMLAHHNAVITDEAGRALGLVYKKNLPSRVYAPLATDPWWPVHGHAEVMRRQLLTFAPYQPQTLEPLDQRCAMPHDRFFFFWATVLGQIAYEKTPLVAYRQHGGNLFGGHSHRKGVEYAWRIIKDSSRFFPSEAAATERNIAILRKVAAQMPSVDKERVEAAVRYHVDMLPDISRRARLYADPSFARRFEAFRDLLRSGAYRNAKPWCFGLGGLAMDYFFGLPFGPALKYLSRGE
jgi:glycosyltransferase involved in cell wall biosynthesis